MKGLRKTLHTITFAWFVSGLDCLEDAACRTEGGQVTGNKVDNVTYCCADPSDYVDMTQVAPGNVTCQCTTTAQAAAAYADRTMSKGTIDIQ